MSPSPARSKTGHVCPIRPLTQLTPQMGTVAGWEQDLISEDRGWWWLSQTRILEQPPVCTQLTSYPLFPLFCCTCSSPIHLDPCLSSPLNIPWWFSHDPKILFPLYPITPIPLWATTSTGHSGGEFLSCIVAGFTQGWRYLGEVLVLNPICVDQKIVPLATSISLGRHRHPSWQRLERPAYAEVSPRAV